MTPLTFHDKDQDWRLEFEHKGREWIVTRLADEGWPLEIHSWRDHPSVSSITLRFKSSADYYRWERED